MTSRRHRSQTSRAQTSRIQTSRAQASRTQTSRAQTSVDFAASMGLFVAVVAFAVWFLPGILAPTASGAELAPVADRVAATLTGPLLGEAGTAGALNATCTVAFAGGGGGADCGFDPSNPVAERVGVDDRYGVNVTVARDVDDDGDPEVLCADGGDVGDCTGGGTRLAAGPDAQAGGASPTTVYRVVTVDGNQALLYVRVWR